MTNLPEYGRPPLNEAVLGVQFVTPSKYSQVYVGKVWELFEKDYPHVEEHQLIEPQFETFGLSAMPQQRIQFITGPRHNRFWFVNDDKCQLIQFQPDRLHHNWRKSDPASNYPRFNAMIDSFSAELQKLKGLFERAFSEELVITQCELTYINHIRPINGRLVASEWLKTLEAYDNEEDEFTVNARRPIKDTQKPIGRIYSEAGIGFDEKGTKLLQYQITVRGMPETSTIDGALDFLKDGRARIVNHFTDTTTPEAHISWGRTR